MLADRADSLIGAMLGKNYRVIERIGSGGMAAVYLVEHQTLLKRFAAKVLSTELASSLEARARFTQEAHAASQLDHENIVTINDFGVTPDHRPFFVMELLRGQTLDQRLAQGAMAIEEVVAVAVPAARALAHAHVEGIVHRDVKPENIFLVQRSQGRWGVKVVDFGIAKTPVTPKLTKMGETLGSPMFMAPEMIRGEDDVDQRADVYSFGVLLYQMLCGRLPFFDENLLKVMHMHLSAPVPPPRAINPGLSIELAEIIDRALAKHPDDRYPSMESLLVDLEAALPTGSDRMLIEAQSGASLHETPFAGALAMSRTGPRPVALPQSQRTSAVIPAAPRQSRALAVVVTAVVVAAAGGGVAWYQAGLHAASGARRSAAAKAPAAAAMVASTPVTASAASAGAAPAPAAAAVVAASTPAPVAVVAAATPPPITAPSAGNDIIAGAAAAAAPVPDEPATAPVAAAEAGTPHTLRPVLGHVVPGKRPAPVALRAPASRVVVRRGQRPIVLGAAPAPAAAAAELAAPPANDPPAMADTGSATPATPEVSEAARAGSDTAGSAAAGSASPAAVPPPVVAVAAPPAAPSPPPAPVPAVAKPVAPAPAAIAPRALDAVPEIASFDLQGSLPASVARRSVERALPGLRSCYSAAARAGKAAPALELHLSFEIDENSIATHVALGDVRFGSFSRCAAGVASQIHTPQAPDVGTAHVVTVIQFHPS